MSSIARSRSLRTKPSAPPSRTSTRASTRDSSSEPRTESPSRLPIKPHARTASAASSSSSSSTRTAATTRRPVSTLSTTTTTRKSPSVLKEQQSSSSLRRETKTSSRYPPSTTLTRPPVQTTTRPKSSSATASSTSLATQPVKKPGVHTRSRSTVTKLDAATVLHPPSAAREQVARLSGTSTTRSGTPTARSGTPTARSGTPTGRAGTPTTTGRPLLRKTGSIDRAAIAAKSQQPPAQTSRPAAVAVAAAAAAQPRVRPAFSTLQQHYSPAKSLAPKPLTATYLAPPSPSKLPANVAATAEISKLQAELLQLYLLHRDAAGTDAQWRASAKKKLGERFAKLCETNKEVSEQERSTVEKQNILALKRWGNGRVLDEKLQSLEAIITGVWSLSDPGGRYARVVRRFERWIDRVYEVEDARQKGTSLALQGQDTLFIGELDNSWKNEREGIIHKLDGWQRQLREIDHLPSDGYGGGNGAEKSSLEKMLEGSRDLIEDMLAELNLMGEIEQQALAREDEWIERINRDEDGDEDTPQAGAVWRDM